MKRILTVLVLSLMLSVASGVGTAHALLTFTFNQAELLAMTKQGDGPTGIGTLDLPYALSGSSVLFSGNIKWDEYEQLRWIDIGYDSFGEDLGVYDRFALDFFNPDEDDWKVALFVGETVTGFTALGRLESAGLTMDISGFNGAGHNIGFRIAFDREYDNIMGRYPGDDYNMVVSPVPEPASMLLLGSGLLGLVGFRRKKRS